jgi:hypothetical protein
MIFHPDQFFGTEHGEGLSPAEKKAGFAALKAHITAEKAEMSRAEDVADVATFFAPAQSVALNAAEKEEALAVLSAEMPVAAFFAAAREVVLADHEKERCLNAIRADAAEGGAPAAEWSWSFLSIRWSSFAAAFVLVLVAGAGITYASDAALPGDFLYPVKRVSEQIQTSLSLSVTSHTEATARHLEKRLREAEVLQERKKLSGPETQVVDQEFRAERRQVLNGIERLEEDGKTEQASAMRARLNAYIDAYERTMGVRPGRDGDADGDAQASASASVHVALPLSVSSSSSGGAASASSLSAAASSVHSSSSVSAASSAGSLQSSSVEGLLNVSVSSSSVQPDVSSSDSSSSGALPTVEDIKNRLPRHVRDALPL